MAFRILVTDKLDKEGIEVLKSYKDIEVIEKETMKGDDLKKELKGYDAIIIRSETKMTRDVIEASVGLKIISRAGVGVDNVDVAAATDKGIIVVNAPGPDNNGVPISIAPELTFSVFELISIARTVVTPIINNIIPPAILKPLKLMLNTLSKYSPEIRNNNNKTAATPIAISIDLSFCFESRFFEYPKKNATLMKGSIIINSVINDLRNSSNMSLT